MRRQQAGPGTAKYEVKVTPAIDPAVAKGSGSYLQKMERDVVNNPTGADLKK
eukprot:CAMPEP_0196996574 /NCGR_PEP_ID=MMETSP1380-20130617/2426_1 /TAXON_ID=5936 /ORGANISM="Euplotes crassus, Strain CT5" /LENGTH=51 /DNA_ID=CAMNT_0042412595 /DNA_START=66 /DNA_END=221 /DNA_ORIENTATION=-